MQGLLKSQSVTFRESAVTEVVILTFSNGVVMTIMMMMLLQFSFRCMSRAVGTLMIIALTSLSATFSRVTEVVLVMFAFSMWQPVVGGSAVAAAAAAAAAAAVRTFTQARRIHTHITTTFTHLLATTTTQPYQTFTRRRDQTFFLHRRD